ncbi:hypothetical protein GCM10007103_06570 [Salinimicrobium marinum]|uniref:histidine kinase n=1 Tax=Salinimicrobium marinum TaxID=680283 RepID=A0A918S922_9FLAO|nr:sensor histidine kinase [Salinimicrobium marinum]GHA27815.1 hypothetical protein GCM10007103_06570 [Salinimicrobium marinum]
MKKAAQVLEARKEDIFNSWMEKVKKEIMASTENSKLALMDHVPHLLEDIITIMERYGKMDVLKEEAIYKEIFENSIEHGRHRATTSGYTVDQILREYIVFHRILTDLLIQEKAYNTEVGVVLKYSIENAMLYSGSAFSESLQEMRQKLLGILAHDMRNPISAAYLAISMMNYEDGEERFEKIRKLAKSSMKRSIDLVESLLDSITVEAGEGITLEFTSVDVSESIKSVYNEASEIYSNEIILKCNDEEIVGVFDETMIRRVLENLLSNAIKYGQRDKPVTISITEKEQFFALKVHNFGNPIPEERQQEIFQFMNTTRNASYSGVKSWGMGLTLVKAVAEAHGGEVRLESSEELGTSFTVSFDKTKNKPGKMKATLNYEFTGN